MPALLERQITSMHLRVSVPVDDSNDSRYHVSPGSMLDAVASVTTGTWMGSGVLLMGGQYLLTAAHVVEGVDVSQLGVHFDLIDGRETYGVLNSFIHPQWNGGWGYDIAVLELASSPGISGLDVYREADEVGQDMMLVGYGVQGTGKHGTPLYDPLVGQVKRHGLNTFDATDQDLPCNFGDAAAGSLLFYDFDDGSFAQDTLGNMLGNPHTGLGEWEVMSTKGDSGGPYLIEKNGTLAVAGIVAGGTGIGGGGITGAIDSSFGEVAYVSRVSYYSEWIEGLIMTANNGKNEVFSLYDSNDMSPLDLLGHMLGDTSGINIIEGSVNYIGADNAVSTFEEFDFGGGISLNNPGVLLTTGDGAPPLENTSASYTVANNTDGDEQFDQLASAAFGGAGKTYDTAVLEFSFEVYDPSIKSVNMDLIFGSEEYPEFVDSAYVDIAAVLVNDVNYGLFDGDPEKPLSIVGNSVGSGSFFSNQDGSFSIEYNGISPRLTISVPMDGSDVYNVRIGIADTGDMALDSGIFLSNFSSSPFAVGGLQVKVSADSEGGELFAAGSNTATYFEGGAGDDIMFGSNAPDIYDLLAGGSNTIKGLAQALNGDTVYGFDSNDVISIVDSFFGLDQFQVTSGSAILDIDTNGDGSHDTQIRLEGDYENVEWQLHSTESGTNVSFVEVEPVVPDGPLVLSMVLDEAQLGLSQLAINYYSNAFSNLLDQGASTQTLAQVLLNAPEARQHVESAGVQGSLAQIGYYRDLIDDAIESISEDSPEAEMMGVSAVQDFDALVA